MMMRRVPGRFWACVVALGLLPAALLAADRYWPPITDPATGVHVPGRWVWMELLTRDVGGAVAFYRQVFDWQFETYGPEDDTETYTLVLHRGQPIAGMVFSRPRDRSMKRDARWVGLISVDDVGTAEARVRAAGGKVLVPRQSMGPRGEAALFADSEGAMFGVIRSATGDPEDYLGETNEWLWAELWADDPARMAEFYRSLGEYEVVPGATPGESGGFHLASGGRARAGILAKPVDAPSTWIPYVRVDDVAQTVARARAAGGHIVATPESYHGTRVALILDPMGAPFAVAEWPGAHRGAGQ
ncbi:MAG TPA: VOC family protein [Steroidobacteraceae bacterium]|nr:VOC family protein [Steroidobacteraceae bacterium]